ncbi:exodeoxyribonuclease V subunit beta [Thiohalocapsa halophila]|uniref:RecBCD enzyme subunit RecB n=1 Tax=Thiohalocapsa halophila TaxID=69359 RepID=A0ABS1CM03_9GAMM|nr:exodeoxyribonuclease V subunit beta [Thiohalocapsa halophila]MBK1632941.1 exodeoxyribonuclease V subunit beta [Thiohalocapsa halophila]
MSAKTLDNAAMLSFPLEGAHLIEASAGTGKTYSIANLYLRQILNGRDVGEVLVVTFTNAATDELRGRLRARLFEALSLLEQGRASDDEFLQMLAAQLRTGPQLETARDTAIRRLRLAVRAMDEAAVLSIHGFCQRALAEFAFNSGQGFGLEVLTDDSPLWRAAVQDWWRRTAYPLDAATAELLAAAVGDLDDFRRRLRPLLGNPQPELLPAATDLAEVLARFDALLPTLAGIAKDWRQARERLAAALIDSKALKRAQTTPFHPDVLAASLTELDDYLADDPTGPPPACFEALDAAVIQHQLKKGKTDPALDDPLFTRCGAVRAELERIRRDLRAAALADAAASARQQVRQAKADGGLLAYDDMLTHLRDALAGAGGEALAAAVTGRFPVAMIDEFQDTDPLQWAIFRRLYLDGPGRGLLLIGDPKQAIYSFRGGDIFTYMAAQQRLDHEARWTLRRNWRSTPAVVQAVNAVFSRRSRDAFVFGDTISFAPSAAADKPHRYLVDGGKNRPALTLWTLPPVPDSKGEPKPPNKDDATAMAHAAVAGEIVRLLAGARAGTVRLAKRNADGTVAEERPLAPKDIAVLVRTRRDGTALRQALLARGINAVSVARDSVYLSDEAAALEPLLAAALDPRDRRLARLALASPLLGLGYAQIARIAGDDAAWADWVDRLQALHHAWQQRGFMAMFQQLLWHTGTGQGDDAAAGIIPVAERLAAGDDAERRLTNLLHLGELLQQAARAEAGMDALLGWFRNQRREQQTEEAGDELQLRLESDADLVQIVTMHAAKGLQYPVVFLPDLWNCKVTPKDGPLRFHRDDHKLCLDIGSDEHDAHLHLAERERLAEDVRLAYVALTRAESAVYVVWGVAGSAKHGADAGRAALGWLLHPHQDVAALTEGPPDAFAGIDALEPDLAALAAVAEGAVTVTELPQGQLTGKLPAAGAAAVPTARSFSGRIDTSWRITSFSALTRDLHAVPPALGERIDDESAAAPGLPGVEADAPAPAPPDDDPALRFPAGSDVGTFLHLLLEHLDFTGDIAAGAERLSARYAARFGLDHRRHGADTVLLMQRAVATPLDAAGFRLADLPAARRLNELAFDLATTRADLGALNRLLAAHAGRPVPALTAADFAGMVTGVIDLVFEHEGRFFVADYKSNLLGRRFDDYAPQALGEAMLTRRYDLQYLLYTLALHRYLATRLPGYDPQHHLGGVYYLFLRGMRPETGPTRGVFFARPAREIITALDEQVLPWGDAAWLAGADADTAAGEGAS